MSRTVIVILIYNRTYLLKISFVSTFTMQLMDFASNPALSIIYALLLITKLHTTFFTALIRNTFRQLYEGFWQG
jgi:hypothetical protein